MGIGAAILFAPVAFEASAGISLGNDVNLLSEIRSPGGSLLAGGAMILIGAFVSRFRHTAVLLAALFYLSYGAGRLISLILDGVPHVSLLMAGGAELLIGGLSLAVLIKLRQPQVNGQPA